jgi:allophanate hydrolase
LVSTSGLVPACRSLDCVSVFALTVADAAAVFAALSGYDAADPFARHVPPTVPGLPRAYRVGVPLPSQRQFFGNDAGAELFATAVRRLEDDGGVLNEVDIEPLLAAGRLLYEGPWVAERYAAIRDFIDRRPEALHPVTRAIIAGGAQPSAADAFAAYYRLRELRRMLEPVWQRIDLVVLPTVGRSYRVREVEADPVRLNAQLGHYTNFVNLLDLCGIAVPVGLQPDGGPFGVTLLGPAFAEAALFPAAGRLHAAGEVAMGATQNRLPATAIAGPQPLPASNTVELVVCGAHMSGLPLNHQLTDRGAKLVAATRTAAEYRLVALADGRPGLERVERGGAIEVEIWAIPIAQLGSFVAAIPPPLGIGTVRLADGRACKGFLCEAIAARKARDITEYGGWRAYLDATRGGSTRR